VVLERETGYLIPPGEEEPLRDALLRLLTAPGEARATMGKRGAERVFSEYSFARMARDYLSVYKGVLKQGEETQ